MGLFQRDTLLFQKRRRSDQPDETYGARSDDISNHLHLVAGIDHEDINEVISYAVEEFRKKYQLK